MAGAASKRVGRGPCPHCGEAVTFKRSAGALLNFKCDACFSSGYAEPGGETHDKWAKTIRPFSAEPAPGPAPAPKPEPAPGPAPAPKPEAVRHKAPAFSLESL